MANGVEDGGLDAFPNGKADHDLDGESGASEELENSTEASTTEKDAPRDGPKENGHSDTPKGLGFGLGRKKAEAVSRSDVQTGVSEEAPVSNGEDNQEVNQVVTNGLVKGAGKGKLKGKGDAMKAMAAAEAAVKRGDREGMYPPSRLGTFYEFLSMAHLQSPLQCEQTVSLSPSMLFLFLLVIMGLKVDSSFSNQNYGFKVTCYPVLKIVAAEDFQLDY
jgi:hypothetical protein